jgi:hypothetical protein
MNRFALTISFAATVLACAATGAAAQQVGIAVCDDFLTKYETCVGTKVPAAQQATFKASLDQTRKAWIDAAKNPAAKTALESSCKQTADQFKTSLAAYGCAF